MARTVVCSYCEQPVDPNGYDTYYNITGWGQARPGGGENKITMRKVGTERVHGHCMYDMKNGIHPSQGAMFA